MTTALLAVQVATYLGLGVALLASGDWRLGVAQPLLAAVQAILFGGGS